MKGSRASCISPKNSVWQQYQPELYSYGNEITDKEDYEDVKQKLVRPLLAMFHLDNDYTAERVTENYQLIYGRRSSYTDIGKRFRKTENKQNLALAFSIANVLSKLGTPRPVDSILMVCGVPQTRRGHLLQIDKWLNLDEEEKNQMDPSTYEWEDPSPQQYVDSLCANLGIPFAIASQIEELAQSSEYAQYGRQPTVLAAAAMQTILRRLGYFSDQGGSLNPSDICEALGCQQRVVSEALRQYPFLSKV